MSCEAPQVGVSAVQALNLRPSPAPTLQPQHWVPAPTSVIAEACSVLRTVGEAKSMGPVSALTWVVIIILGMY